MLENSYTNLFDEVSSLGNEAKCRSDDLAGKLQAEITARSEADKKIEEQMKETAVGSFHLDFLRVAFVLLGIVARTASPEIAAGFGATGCR